jgi:ribonuclease III
MSSLSVARLGDLAELEKSLTYQFSDKSYLEKALTHRSYSSSNNPLRRNDNEQLEFLGDAVLKLVVSDFLLREYPHEGEGELTKIRSVSISDDILAEFGHKLMLGSYMRFSENKMRAGGGLRDSTIGNALEAIYGAVYLDGGLDEARQVILHVLKDYIVELACEKPITDFKTHLQELLQREGSEIPEYALLGTTGPDHDKSFVSSCSFQLQSKGLKTEGTGKTKKRSEQEAAKIALSQMGEKV